MNITTVLYFFATIFSTVLDYVPHLESTPGLDARVSYICNSTPCRNLDAGTQISSDNWILGLEGARRMDSLVPDTIVIHWPLPSTCGKSAPDIGKMSSHPRVIVSKIIYSSSQRMCLHLALHLPLGVLTVPSSLGRDRAHSRETRST